MLTRKLQVLRNTITKLLRKNAHRRLQFIIEKVHVADLSVVFRFLNEEQQDTLFSLLPSPLNRAELLENLDENIGQRLIEGYSAPQIAEVVKNMSDDDAADLIQDFDPEKVAAILGLLKKDDREDIRELIRWEEESAGGLMTTDFVSIPSSFTVGQATEVVQQTGDDAEMVFYIYVVDEEERLEGVISLREIVQNEDDLPVTELMETDIHKVRPDRDQEDVARIISRYDLLAVPVVDEENRILGIVTVDDIIDVIREEATEDILQLVGADEKLFEQYSVKQNIVSRLPWLLATWIGGVFVMRLVGHYESELSQVIALTAFFPVILGMSGNLGQQSATIIVRGLAIGQVDVTALASTVSKEAVTGFVIGLVYGAAIGGVAWFQFGGDVLKIPLVVALSQATCMIVAAVFGAFVPLSLSRLKVDPAVATGPIVTTTLDIVGMFIYMQIATALIF